MGKRSNYDTHKEIIERLIRLEDKIDHRMENHGQRIRSLESFRAFARGSTAVVVMLAGSLISYVTGIFK